MAPRECVVNGEQYWSAELEELHEESSLEGFHMGPIPSMEQGFVYEAAEEKAWNRVSLVADHNQESSLVYLGGGTFTVRDQVFKPTYRYVLSRLPNVATNRRILAAGEGIALEVRGTHRPDVTVDFGLTVPPPGGTRRAWRPSIHLAK